MNRVVASLLLISACVLLSTVRAGDIKVTEFRPGAPHGREVLARVPVKVMIAEFIDPQGIGLGKSLGYMLWREALTAVHDQRGAGIIYAHQAGDTPLVDLLRKDYHQAAQEIARGQKSRVVLWGAVGEEHGQVFIDSYLTVLPELIGDSLTLSLESEQVPLPGFSTPIARIRYSFSQVRYSRSNLFRRAVTARPGARIRERPARAAAVIKSVATPAALQAEDMRADWLQVVLVDGREGWVRIDQVDIPPRWASVDRASVNIRRGPGKSSPVEMNRDLHGTYSVLDSRYLPGKGVWYQLQFPWGKGWVAAFLTQPRFTLPAIQFMAGLQRYQLRNYPEADAAFGRFIAESGEKGSNVTRAAAHAMRAASILMQDAGSRLAQKELAKAAALTPYDPLVYNLRVLSAFNARWLPPAGRTALMLKDLSHSLELDPRNPETRKLLKDLVALSERKGAAYRVLRRSFRMGAATRERLNELSLQYPE